MKRVFVALIAGTVLSGLAAAYASANQRTDMASSGKQTAPKEAERLAAKR